MLRENEKDFRSLKSKSVIRNILIKGKDNKSRLQKDGHCLDYVTAWVTISRLIKLVKQIILLLFEKKKNQKSS